MPTWRLDIEYEGTRYGGWQKQLHARTVQGELLKAAESFLDTKVDIGGAGRTDAGVHALQQVAHLRLRPRKEVPTPSQLLIGINDLLPSDINVKDVRVAPSNFHARHDATARYYIYQIATRRTAFGKTFVWWVKDRLNVKAMTEASRLLVGRHDFRSFCEKPGEQKSTLVHVDAAQVFTSGGLILLRIGASHFLWKMVRRVVGTLVETGRGNLTVADFRALIEGDSREPARWTAPPSGLFLERVLYDGDTPPTDVKPAFPIP